MRCQRCSWLHHLGRTHHQGVSSRGHSGWPQWTEGSRGLTYDKHRRLSPPPPGDLQENAHSLGKGTNTLIPHAGPWGQGPRGPAGVGSTGHNGDSRPQGHLPFGSLFPPELSRWDHRLPLRAFHLMSARFYPQLHPRGGQDFTCLLLFLTLQPKHRLILVKVTGI